MVKKPWYLFNEHSIGIILWEILMGMPLLFVFITVPILQAIETLKLGSEETTTFIVFQKISETLFMLDLVLSFFKVPLEMKEPTLKKTSKHYLYRFFVVDFLATVPGQVIYFFPGLRQVYYLLTYLRVVRIRKIPEAYSVLVRLYLPININQYRVLKFESIVALVLYYI